jgi:hypothetical protein
VLVRVRCYREDRLRARFQSSLLCGTLAQWEKLVLSQPAWRRLRNIDFVEGAVNGNIALVRSAVPPAAIHTRNVTFRNGDVALAGSLILPASGGTHPAILFLQG